MNTLWSRFRSMVRRLLNGASSEQQLSDEVQSYLQHDIDSRMESGVSPAEARRKALIELGGTEQVKEHVRAERTGALLDSLRQDVRYAVRTLIAARGFSLTVVGSLGIGIAATVAAVAFLNAWMFRPFPGVAHQEQLLELRPCEWQPGQSGCWFPTSLDDYLALREGLTGFQGLTAFTSANVAVAVPEARSLRATLVSEDYFDVLGVRPVIGRTFAPEEGQLANARVAVIAHRMWIREFNADPSVLGRSIRVGNESMRIIGVAPRWFGGLEGTMGSPGTELWLPISLADLVSTPDPRFDSPDPGALYIRFVGRRKDGVEIDQIRAAADVLATQIAAARNKTPQPGTVQLSEVGMFRRPTRAVASTIIMIMPILVLAIACVNAANVLLARATRRGREIAIRLAIGASRWRVIRQLLIESLLLSIAATAAALTLAWWGLRLAASYLALPIPFDATVLAATLLTAVASAVGFGLAPALRVSAQRPASALASSHAASATLRQSRGRRRLVVAQVALSLGLLVTGTQLVSTMKALGGTAGTPPDRLLMASFNLDQLKLSPAESRVFYQQLLNNVNKLPQAEAAGLGPPLWTKGRGVQAHNSISVWRATDSPRAGTAHLGGYVEGDLFEAIGLRVLQGRGFTPADRQVSQPQVAIVNLPFAMRYFEGAAIGQTVRVAARDYTSSVEVRIVGVIEPVIDPQYTSRDGAPVPAVYVPSPLKHEPALTLYVRSRGDLAALAPAVRDVVHQLDPRVPLLELASLEQVNERSLVQQLWLARGAAFLGFIALLLATAGLYGVVSYIVGLRSREIALRLALGATPQGILKMVFMQAMAMALIGSAIGGAAGFAISRALQAANRVHQGLDPIAFGGSAVLLMCAMLVASVIPAMRAARVDPVVNLREN